ncbi:hypothetical protein [Dysgonomonas gadei]|uniref:hypothetical protein n=1 Tax=Dysgonomonas gadei TaxID=156974 RepID=UPI003AF178E7
MLKKLHLTCFAFVLLFPLFAQESQTIHVMVALCDNKYQGIVKVPKGIGNGQDPNSNLYWGCGYGIRTYFRKGSDWKEVRRLKVDNIRLERIVFKHKTKDYYLVADAYDGQYIKNCTEDFLNSCSGSRKDTVMVGKTVVGLNGNAKLLAYIGHNGLMDFSLANTYSNVDGKTRDAIILACYSKRYFTPYLRSAKANPLLWSTHLMSPEAYTLHDAIATYIAGGTNAAVRESAAVAYNKYQKCGIKGARGLLTTGF